MPARPARRAGRLSADRGAAASFWERVFDTATGELRLERRGRFWDAVATARRTGARGNGRRIAIIDGGFDLTVEALRHSVHPSSTVRPDTIAPCGHHGTVVALLARAVAPEAELLLLDVFSESGLVPDDVAAAVDFARRFDVDAINLSVEFPTDCEPMGTEWIDVDVLPTPAPPIDAYLAQVDAWITHAEPYAGAGCRSACTICTSLADVPAKALVVAASGNQFDATCPACGERVVGVGFHQSRTVERDGIVFTTWGLPDTSANSLRPEITVEEPPGFLGTSFAAPLLTAFGVLTSAPADLASMARMGRAMTPVLALAQMHATVPPADIPDGAPHILHEGLLRVAGAIPEHHQHWKQDLVTQPCALCALVFIDWYNVFTSMLVASGAAGSAVGIARIAAVVAPDAASVSGNHGLACRTAAAEASDEQRRRALLVESEHAYRQAVSLAPDVARYAGDLANVLAALGAG